MAPQQTLNVGTLVWAKVEPYPWWPGRIVKTIIQQRQRVYKIAFFADPTYTYLHLHQIQPFSPIHPDSNDHLRHNPLLQKAVFMAQAHHNKLAALHQPKIAPQSAQLPSSLSLPQNREEFREQNSINSQSKQALLSLNDDHEVSSFAQEPTIDEISPENVIRLLQRLRRKKVKSAYCYQKRKEQIRYQDRLKDQLLKRYNLLDIAPKYKKEGGEPQQQYIQITVSPAQYIPQKKSRKISKHSSRRQALSDHIQFLTKRCIRKIYAILKNNIDSPQNTRQQSMELVKRMVMIADNNSMKLKSLFVTLVKTMSGSQSSMSCSQKLGNFRHYLQRLQGDKGQDQQGSKITQIEANLN